MARGRGGKPKSEILRRVLDNHRDTINPGTGNANAGAPNSNSASLNAGFAASLQHQQPKLFPDYHNAPIPTLNEDTLSTTDRSQLEALKQLKEYWVCSPFYIRHPQPATDVERYSDRYYRQQEATADLNPFELVDYGNYYL
jgi:hypothetical protein